MTQEDWQEQLANSGELSSNVVEMILEQHGDRGRKAIDAVTESRVKQYRDFTVVVGYNDEYIIEDKHCTCKDAEFNLDANDPSQKCWHVLAATIAKHIGELDHHDMWYSDVGDFF